MTGKPILQPARIGSAGTVRERHEEGARDYLDVHGHWPDERER